MKKLLLVTLTIFMAFSMSAQRFIKLDPSRMKPVPVQPQPSPAPVFQPGEVAVPSSTLGFRTFEEQLGITKFDLQTANSLGRRIADFGNEGVSGIWLYGNNQGAGWPDRGSAYNYRPAGGWGDFPEGRLEATRSGYPSYTRTASGKEIVLSHKNTSATQWYLTCHTKTPGETDWTEVEIPSAVTGGPVWSKVAAGGPDGNTLHVVAVSVAPDFGGVIYEGVNQHMLYWRSPDGGETWDKTDFIIPGLDSAFYDNIGGEAYQIEANGETVAVAVFDSWGDLAVFKSEDNGDTWDKTIIWDFPLDKYNGEGYTTADIPFDPNAPDTLSILTSDAAGSLLIDDDGEVHVFFGWMYVSAVLTDYFYTPGMSGLAHWQESEPANIQLIADLEDLNGDSVLNISDTLGLYGFCLTGSPTAGVDEDGNLYVIYSALTELYRHNAENANFRHLFIIKSEDNGANWSAPFDLINEETTELYDLAECVYPSIPPVIGNSIHLIYQQDFRTGLANGAEPDPFEDNYMTYLNLDKNTFGEVSDAGEVAKNAGSLIVYPNPASGNSMLEFELNTASEVQISVTNLLGTALFQTQKGQMPAGKFSEPLPLEQLANGVYIVSLQAGNKLMTGKIVVQH